MGGSVLQVHNDMAKEGWTARHVGEPTEEKMEGQKDQKIGKSARCQHFKYGRASQDATLASQL